MIGNTTPDAIKFMRNIAVETDTDAGGNVFIGAARQSAGYPLVVLSVISKTFTPTQDSSSAVDEIRVQVDVFAKTSKDEGDASAFEIAHNIDYALRAAWSRQKSITGDFENAIDSIQEVGGFEDAFPENDIYQVSTDYIVRIVGSGTTVPAAGITVQSNIFKRKKITLTYKDFQYADVTNVIELGFTLPAKGILRSITMQPTIYFAGNSITEYTIEVGTFADTDKYIVEQSVFTGATLPEFVFTGGTLESMTSPTVFAVRATSTGNDLSFATAGSVSFWINYEILN